MAKTKTPKAVSKPTHWHEYHADAHVLSGHLKHPVERKIKPHAPLALKGTRGGHHTRTAQNVSIDGLISFKRGHTRVSGSRTLKHQGWVTLSTSLLEGLNVFEVLTADRVVSQVSTEHLYENGHIPHVTFLGSHFNNLQINGFPVKLTLNLEVCGKKPDSDRSYLEEVTFLKAARAQIEKVAKAGGLPKDLETEYANRLAAVEELISSGGKANPEPRVTCSLVQSIDNISEIPVPGIRAIGHVLVIPDFGWVALGEVEVGAELYEGASSRKNVCNYFALKMLDMHLGCIGGGVLVAGGSGTNGQTYP